MVDVSETDVTVHQVLWVTIVPLLCHVKMVVLTMDTAKMVFAFAMLDGKVRIVLQSFLVNLPIVMVEVCVFLVHVTVTKVGLVPIAV
jgi:hypothetical protein